MDVCAEEDGSLTLNFPYLCVCGWVGGGGACSSPSCPTYVQQQMEWSGVRGERKRVLMDLDVMTQQHSPFIVQCYGFIIEEVSVGVVHAQVVGCGCEVQM